MWSLAPWEELFHAKELLRDQLVENSWGSWWWRWTGVSSVPLQQWRQTTLVGIIRIVDKRSRKVILHFLWVLWKQIWSTVSVRLNSKRQMNKLKWVQCRVNEVIRGLEHVMYIRTEWEKPCLFRPGKWLQGKPSWTLSNDGCRKARAKHFPELYSKMQGTINTSCSERNVTRCQEKKLPWMWLNTRTGCPEYKKALMLIQVLQMLPLLKKCALV